MFAAVVAGSVPIIAQILPVRCQSLRRSKRPHLAQAKEINAFLASVERRAFKHAAYAVRDDDAALDIVQDLMMKLTESYADKPAAGAADAVHPHPAEHHSTTSAAPRRAASMSPTFQKALVALRRDDDFDVLRDSGVTGQRRR